MKTLRDIDVDGKTILLQLSLDVPIVDGKVTDDARLQASQETLMYLLHRGCKIVITGHVGRPKGKLVPELSTKPVADALKAVIDAEIHYIPHISGPEAKEALEAVPSPGVAVLENIRSDPREENPTEDFAEELAMLADVFVNDDYPDIHRATACNVLVPKYLPSVAGFSLAQEVSQVHRAINHPEHPLVLIIGGAKADKIGVINNMMGIADHIIVGGVLANTFLKASGVDVKKSKWDERSLEIAGEFLRDHEEKFLLPVDVVAADNFSEDASHVEVSVGDIPEKSMILDIGSQTIQRYEGILSRAKTVIWGGPVGAFEWKAFRRGTEEIAQFVSNADAFSLVAGGDSGAAVHALGLGEKVSHVSIGGGATLALIAGDSLPALEALED